MRFAVGADVFVAELRQFGTVEEVAANGRCRVSIGALKVWCDGAQLSSAAEAGKTGKRRRDQKRAAGVQAAPRVMSDNPTSEGERRALASLDLHGMTVEEALHAVEVRLDLAMRGGLDRLEIIHGVGGGRLRHAVRRLLAGISSVKRVETDPRNAGVTIAWM